jgi:hypothetical protein
MTQYTYIYTYDLHTINKVCSLFTRTQRPGAEIIDGLLIPPYGKLLKIELLDRKDAAQ